MFTSRDSRFLSLPPFCFRAGYWLSLLHDYFSKFTSTRTYKYHQWPLFTPIHVAGGALGSGRRREGRGEAECHLTKTGWPSLLSKQTVSPRHGSDYLPLFPDGSDAAVTVSHAERVNCSLARDARKKVAVCGRTASRVLILLSHPCIGLEDKQEQDFPFLPSPRLARGCGVLGGGRDVWGAR